MTRPLSRLLLVLLVVLGAPALGEATARYVVATGGSDTRGCLLGSPCATIYYASTQAVAGDVVHVAPGTYDNTAGPIVTTASGTSGNPITYVSDTRWGAKLISSNRQLHVWENGNGSTVGLGDWVVIDGFDISGGYSVGLINYADHVRIKNNRVHNNIGCQPSNGGAGIDQYGSDHGGGFRTATDNWITNNLVFNNYDDCSPVGSDPGHHGIYFAYGDGFIINNIVYGNGTPSGARGYGIHLWHAPVNVKIYNNLVFHNASAGIIVGNQGFSPEPQTTGIVVANNIFYDNGLPGGGSRCQARSFGNVAANNTVFQDNLLNAGPHGSGFEDWTSPNCGGSPGITPVESGTVTSGPAFVNYQADGSGDYHLTSGSPAKDAGVTHTEASPDLDGITRPQGPAYDIGPYEFVASGGGVPAKLGFTVQPGTSTAGSNLAGPPTVAIQDSTGATLTSRPLRWLWRSGPTLGAAL